MPRCAWAEGSDAYRNYHDTEWGVPSFDDRHLFEMLILEGAQAGLNWSTILARREGYRRAYDGFDAAKIAMYTEADQARLLADPGIVRNRAKVAASIQNAQACLRVQEETGGLAAFLWGYLGGVPLQNGYKSLEEIPPETPLSKAISKDLVKRGFRFVGPTIVYAFMQAVGMVNDHLTTCPRYGECRALSIP